MLKGKTFANGETSACNDGGNPVPSPERSHRIYLITNSVTNKVYVGQTVGVLKERFNQHMAKAMRTGGNNKFHSSIRKHGKGNFKIELIEDNISSREIDEKEIAYIEQFDSVKNGYNTSRGGDRKSLTPLDQSKVIELYKAGSSSSEIGGLFNVSGTTIVRILHANNVPTRVDNNKRAEIEETFKGMYLNTEISTKEIADKFSISPHSVRRWGRKYGLPARERPRKGVETIGVVAK